MNTRRGRRNLALGVAASALGGAVGAGMGGGDPAIDPATNLALNDASPAVSFKPEQAWDIKQTKNDKVDFFIEFLMGKNHDKTKLWLERLGKYGPMIQQKLADRGMPQDL